MSAPNTRWEFLNGRHVNICIDCGKEFGNEHPLDVTRERNVIRCRDCIDIAADNWFKKAT